MPECWLLVRIADRLSQWLRWQSLDIVSPAPSLLSLRRPAGAGVSDAGPCMLAFSREASVCAICSFTDLPASLFAAAMTSHLDMASALSLISLRLRTENHRQSVAKLRRPLKISYYEL